MPQIAQKTIDMYDNLNRSLGDGDCHSEESDSDGESVNGNIIETPVDENICKEVEKRYGELEKRVFWKSFIKRMGDSKDKEVHSWWRNECPLYSHAYTYACQLNLQANNVDETMRRSWFLKKFICEYCYEIGYTLPQLQEILRGKRHIIPRTFIYNTIKNELERFEEQRIYTMGIHNEHSRTTRSKSNENHKHEYSLTEEHKSYCISKNAVNTIHEAAEQYIQDLMNNASIHTHNRSRETMKPSDLYIAIQQEENIRKRIQQFMREK